MIKKINKFIRNLRLSAFPVGSVLLGIFIGVLPYQSDNFSVLLPFFSLITIYFWTIYRPNNLSYFSLLVLGLLKDVLENDVLGLNALCFIVFQAMIKSRRKYIINNSFNIIWFGFTLFSGLITLLYMLLVNFNNNVQFSTFSIMCNQWLITVLVYIPLHYLLNNLQNINSSFNE